MSLNPEDVRAALADNLSLNATLVRLGIQRAEATWGHCDYVDASGVVLFSGRANDAWGWLRSVAGVCSVCGDYKPVAAYGGWCCAKALAGA